MSRMKQGRRRLIREHLDKIPRLVLSELSILKAIPIPEGFRLSANH